MAVSGMNHWTFTHGAVRGQSLFYFLATLEKTSSYGGYIKQLERSSSAKTGESGRRDERELDTYDHAN
jgi:hypothetical protein